MNISELDHLRAEKNCKFKEETLGGDTYTIVSYMVSDPSYWKIPGALETRGIVFNSRGECVSRPFEKFFNLNENPETQDNVLNWNGITVREKIDGSMVVPVLLRDGSIRFKTKKTFFNEISESAQKFFEKLPNSTQVIVKAILQQGITPIFEYTSPENRIVIEYPEALWFLAARSNADGSYIPFAGKLDGINVPRTYSISREEILNSVTDLSNLGGYVITLSNGKRIKVKCPWYLSPHRVMTEIRERDIARAVIEEEFDDIYAMCVKEKPELSPILLDIQNKVLDWVRDVIAEVVVSVGSMPDGSTAKDAALKYHGHPLFDLIMTEFRGNDTERLIKKRFIRDELENYSLKPISGTFN